MITIAFSTHRLEVLSRAEKLMWEHDIIALEEPPHPLFDAMLRGEVSVKDYVREAEYEFPEFARASCELYRRLYCHGKSIVQVDPYMEHLAWIHEFFASGGTSDGIDPSSTHCKVYQIERKTTAALLNFYRMSLIGTFEDVVQSVKTFAKADAERISLRDKMRAESLAVRATTTSKLYVEAGYIHFALPRHLRKLIHCRNRIEIVFLLRRETEERIGLKQVLGPGDRLTLLFMFHPNWNEPLADLLAAQSLIFVKLLNKNELEPQKGSFPHLDDEATAYLLTKNLSWDDCRKLWHTVKFRHPEEAREIVKIYLGKKPLQDTRSTS
ncbi:MAG: hypothetical protein WHS38_08900 [Thermodesulforhabdaceae bacterium]